MVLVVAGSERPFMGRGLDFDLTGLPVPAQVLVYTVDELERLVQEGGRFGAVLQNETVWVWERP